MNSRNVPRRGIPGALRIQPLSTAISTPALPQAISVVARLATRRPETSGHCHFFLYSSEAVVPVPLRRQTDQLQRDVDGKQKLQSSRPSQQGRLVLVMVPL